MLIASGALLVLVTWSACVVALAALGVIPALAVTPRGGPVPVISTVARWALWWGLLIVTVFAYLANLVWPLGSGVVSALAISGIIVLGGSGVLLVKRRRMQMVNWPSGRERRWAMALVGAFGLSLAYLAVAALGPVTNFDSGLYHLGAIRYAADYPTVPGLANLFFALGYGNAEFPLAALLGNGPWGTEGFRLLNGLVMSLAVADLGLRLGQRRLSPGFFVLAVGMVSAWVPLVALSDYWVTSPTQDSSVFIITVVATAYLADIAWGGRWWLPDAAVAAVLGVQLILLRPTMVTFAAATAAIISVLTLRRSRTQRVGKPVVVAATWVAVATVVALVAATVRDRILSGWVQYPLSIYSFPEPWTAPDPTQFRAATLGYHRNPADLWNSIDGWDWVGPWLSNRLNQWETYELLGLGAVAVVLMALASRTPRRLRWRGLVLAWLPSALATLVWFTATPPSYRFAWGAIFTMATVPIGWALWALHESKRQDFESRSVWIAAVSVAVGASVLLVTGYSLLARFDWSSVTQERDWQLGLSIPYVVSSSTQPHVEPVSTASGLDLLVPRPTGLCWGVFPLCTPEPDPNLQLRGEGLESGFTVR